MNSKQNTNRQKQMKNVTKSIFTTRSERSDVEIQKHFNPSKISRDEINTGVDSFPIVGDVESNVEVSVNIDKPNKKTKKSFFVDNPTEISLDVILPNEIDANIEFFDNNNDFNTCTSLNKKVEDINKQLADLEKDIQFNFYDPKTKVGSNLKKYSSHLQSFSSSKNPSNTTTSTASDYGNFNKFNNAPKQSDASIELKNEIYSYRSSLKQKSFEEKIEKRLEKLHKQKEQSELRKNETKGEPGHEPTCPLSLKIDLPEPVLKIHEMQLTAKRLKIAEGGAPSTSNAQNASSSQTSLQKVDPTAIQNRDPEQEQKASTSMSNDTANNENNSQITISDVDVGVVRQLNTLLKKSTNELDELKCLLKKYLKTEQINRSPRSDKNVKFTITHQDDPSSRKKSKPPSRSSSNSDVSLTRQQNAESRKKLPRAPPQPQTQIDIEKKSKVIKIKQISNNTKCELSDISESNEMERNSSSSDIIKKRPVSVKKQNKTTTKPAHIKKTPNTSNQCKTTQITDKQTEFILNIVTSKSSSSLLSSDEDKRAAHIRDFIERSPKDSNDLTNPPNTVRLPPPPLTLLPTPEKNTNPICKKKSLEIQILPALDIKRSLITQKLPDVAIESIDDFVDSSRMSSENVKYIEIMHGADKDLPPKEQESSSIVAKQAADKPAPAKNVVAAIQTDRNKDVPCCANIVVKSKTTDVKIEEIYIAQQQQLLSSCDAFSRDDMINGMPSTPNEGKKPKDVPKERGTVSEELNLDIDSLPSVRTLKEIQNYLEQKCALIRSRLDEESKLKTGETLSLRYKLAQPPLWQQSSKTELESIPEPEPEPEQNPKPVTLSPLKTYSSIKRPLSPLQKHDKCQQISSTSLISIAKPKLQKSPAKTVDKSLQVSISDNMELAVGRKDSSAQFSIETSSKDVPAPSLLTSPPKTASSIRQLTISTQNDNDTKACKDVAINTSNIDDLPKETNSTHKNQATIKPLTDDVNQFSDISTQINEFDYVKHPAAKHVSFEIVTKQFSFVPNENKETQISQLDFAEEMPKTPIGKTKKKDKKIETVSIKCKDEKTQTQTGKKEAVIKEKETPLIVRYLQSNATQTMDVKDKCVICNIEQRKEIDNKETKECCTQCSPVPQQQQQQQQDLDATEYKHININSFRKVDRCENEDQIKHVHYPPKDEYRYYYKSKMKNKRQLPAAGHRVCSTPLSPSSISTTTETVSLSDGEVKLSCECSTSIGEIHLCRFANNIRKKVRILKQNPEEVLKESFGVTNFKMKREHKYNDNWFAYYVTKTESSSEQGTGSNLSSIKSNIETE